MPDRQQRVQDAGRLLAHYFRTAFDRAGLPWCSDNESEMLGLADALIEPEPERDRLDALTARVETVEKLAEDLRRYKADAL